MVAKFGIINDVLNKWYIKCCQVGIYPDGAMLKEEALKIKTELKYSNLGDFKTSNGQLEHFKKKFWFQDRQEQLEKLGINLKLPSRLGWSDFQKLFKVILLMTSGTWTSQGSFLKLFQILGQHKKSVNGDKKSKERLTVAFFVSISGFKVCKPVVIGKSKAPRCFRRLPNASGIQYFHSKKAWMIPSNP